MVVTFFSTILFGNYFTRPFPNFKSSTFSWLAYEVMAMTSKANCIRVQGNEQSSQSYFETTDKCCKSPLTSLKTNI